MQEPAILRFDRKIVKEEDSVSVLQTQPNEIEAAERSLDEYVNYIARFPPGNEINNKNSVFKCKF